MSVSDAIDTRSASGRLVLNVLGSVAEWERQAISERTKEGLSAVKRQGYKFGTPPLGYRYAEELDEHGRKVWEVDPAQQRSLARLLELHDAGKSTPEIAEVLRVQKG
jgi:site-specific DNA recombinase